MGSLSAVRTAVASQLGDQLCEWSVYPSLVAMPTTPAIMVINGAATARDGFTRKSASYPLQLLAVVSMTDLPSAQAQIDSLRERGSGTSAYDILETDTSLGGVAQTLICGDISEDQSVQIGDRGLFYGCYFDVTVVPII